MAKKGKKKQKSDHRENARHAVFEGGPWDGKKWWIVYPCPKKLMMDMGREPYYLAEGGTNPPKYVHDPDRFNEEEEVDFRWL